MTAQVATDLIPTAQISRAVWLRRLRDFGIPLIALALFVALSFSSPYFLTVPNLLNVLNAAVPMGIIACAATLVIVAGGFDLSAGAIFAVGAVVSGLVTNSSGPFLGIVAGLATGAALGLVNGLLVTVGGIHDFVATIATNIAFAGLATLLSQAALILIADPGFGAFATTKLLGVTSAAWMFVLFAVLCAVLLNRTVWGRYLVARGGNLKASRHSGVPVNRTKMLVYVFSGTTAALAGIIVASRSMSVNANTGSGIVFEAIAAVLIGGNSVLGGEGAIWRTLVGVLTLTLISNGTNLLGIDPLYQNILTGVIIIVAVAFDAAVRRVSK